MKLKALNKKYQIALILVAIMLIISGVSYAYFAVTATGSSNPNIVTSGTMKITFTDGPEVRLDNAIPGDTLTKTFSVTNTGNVSTSYDIFLSEIADTFADQSDLVYTITSDKGVNITSDTQLPGEDDSLSSNIAIGVGETHNYTLTIKFLNKNQAQDTNQGKQYSAKVNVIAYDLAEENAIKIKTSNFNYAYNTIAILDGITVTQIPANDGTVVATNTTCDNNITGTWDNTKWGLFLTNINNTTTTTTCTIQFRTLINSDYTGAEQKVVIPKSGYYKLETWGAQGGTYNSSYLGGYGSYSTGYAYFDKGTTIYINVGGQSTGYSGGYNGGGGAVVATDSRGKGFGGGGATHIATKSGVLSTLASNKSDILIIAGGGGGAAYFSGETATSGNAGGYLGTSGTSTHNISGTGGSQTAAGHANNNSVAYGGFGYGGTGVGIYSSAGGGGGLYGGGGGYTAAGLSNASGGGGSGYIANTTLISSPSITKHMTCYNCSTSATDTTKTLSNSNVSDTPTIDYSKSGNGYSRITFIGASLN